MSKKKKRELVLKSGAVFAVTGETNRYYLCEGTQFRKGNPDIAEIREKPYATGGICNASVFKQDQGVCLLPNSIANQLLARNDKT